MVKTTTAMMATTIRPTASASASATASKTRATSMQMADRGGNR